MLNILLRHIKLPTNDDLLWDNLTTVHSVYNYANMYSCISAIDSICNLLFTRPRLKICQRKQRDNQKTQ